MGTPEDERKSCVTPANATPEGRERNRRIEITLFQEEEPLPEAVAKDTDPAEPGPAAGG